MQMSQNKSAPTYCNARKRGNGDLEKAEPGPYAGDGYCKQAAGAACTAGMQGSRRRTGSTLT